MEAPMKIQTKGFPAVSTATTYINQIITENLPSTGQERHVSSIDDDSQPLMKRLKPSEPSLGPSNPIITSSELQELSGNPISLLQSFEADGSNYLNGSLTTTTPYESTTSSSHTASRKRKSTSTSTTPVPSLPTPPLTAGVSVFHNGNIDFSKCRPRSSIPLRMPPGLYGEQCVAAAYASRLDPYALHPKEQAALQELLCHVHVTAYLNIRNGILRLWTRNAMISVTRDEALGCAKDYRWMDLASFSYDWLVRYGYINFGCVETPVPPVVARRGRRKEGPVIVVIGAGVGGLGCARQLESLFIHYRDAETAPRVVVLEGRRRIGGRIYSHPLHSMPSQILPPGLVPKAEMGAQIIVGFDNGNPLDLIVRSQLALHYHLLRDISTIYDIDGFPVDEVRDTMDEKLYNDVLDRSGFYRRKAVINPTAEGDRELIDDNRESAVDDGLTVRQYENARATGTEHLLVPTKRVRRRRGVGHKTADAELAYEMVVDHIGPSKEHSAAVTSQAIGWNLKPGYTDENTVDLDAIANVTPTQTLGAVLDEGVKQYQQMLPLTPRDMRLLNWHYANLEYANATNVHNLSLSSWDQDIGNEFEGEHSQVIGGYSQLPFGLYSLPTKLDVRTNQIVSDISYDPSGKGKAVVRCEGGEQFAADHVVFTGSLGTLKHQTIKFNPPLPDWKSGAIERLGFGVMNKVVLVFEEPFWDIERDMFGLLREPTNPVSMVQEDYARNRGRFYLFWNCIRTTGLPVLIALMAGDSAIQAETRPDDKIIAEVTSQLRNVFKHTAVPDPLETIITRWASDKFTYGSYSYVASKALPEDYNLMAQQVGNLHFAGEATCGTHPATVHGAYLSGLRAAAEIIEAVVGPIVVANPLVPEKSGAKFPTPTPQTQTQASQPSHVPHPSQLSQPVASEPLATTSSSRGSISQDKIRQDTYEQAMWTAIYAEIGSAPIRPKNTSLNPFLQYQKDYWAKCRVQTDNVRREATGNPNAKAGRDEIRKALGQMWRDASPCEKQPYLEHVEANRRENEAALVQWKAAITEWERRSYEVKDAWCGDNPYETWVMS
ncbi:Winged helix-turn-helix transcription repressor DNA-binding [Penicillium taxi]|uniref:Winged helix-turn-helix transcription repressor DNA-binding n=1 Tax=Penicillium taxi TaxID=168475 RepID=UPI0025454F28|nr:Winged helix-turn-helix transcription repressor DNA-binding [Penicillium taxi]KAJ5898959.1 Winged helix-turn-helix transcription repressor DNA-binding [Penicillium taxi]